MAAIAVGPTRTSNPRNVPLNNDVLENVRASGKTLSQYLEEVNPTDRGADLDAFERQLERFNIRLTPDLKRGVRASSIHDFWQPTENDGQTALSPERWAPEGEDNVRFFASNQPQSWALFPEFINRIIRATPLAEDVLEELIALTTPINTASYQAVYLKDTVVSRRLNRVAEGAAIPRLYAQLGEQTVFTQKYALAIEGTYEFARRIQIPFFVVWLNRIRQQLRLDMAAQAADVLVNGDGNNNAATNYNVSTLDSAAGAGPGTVTDPYLSLIGDPNANSTITKALTYKAFLTWRASLYPLGMTTIVGRLNEILQLLQLQIPTINPTMLLALLGGPGMQIVPGRIELPDTDLWGNARLIYLPFAPGGMLIGLNKSQALEMLMEQDSDLTETDKNIIEQKNLLTISQNTGFDKIITRASSALTFA